MVKSEQPATLWRPVKLRAEDFLLLAESGAFEGYAKKELLDGELWGELKAPEGHDQWHDIVPILLRPIDHELLRDRGKLDEYQPTKLIEGVICARAARSASIAASSPASTARAPAGGPV